MPACNSQVVHNHVGAAIDPLVGPIGQAIWSAAAIAGM
jgi:hypothetical protein